MSIAEKLAERTPQNEHVASLIRTRREFEQDKTSHLSPARQRLVPTDHGGFAYPPDNRLDLTPFGYMERFKCELTPQQWQDREI